MLGHVLSFLCLPVLHRTCDEGGEVIHDQIAFPVRAGEGKGERSMGERGIGRGGTAKEWERAMDLNGSGRQRGRGKYERVRALSLATINPNTHTHTQIHTHTEGSTPACTQYRCDDSTCLEPEPQRGTEAHIHSQTPTAIHKCSNQSFSHMHACPNG
jgi:hypothetical protein